MTSSFYKKQIFRFVQKIQGFFVLMRQHPIVSFLGFVSIFAVFFAPVFVNANTGGIVSSATTGISDSLIVALVNVCLIIAKIAITVAIFCLRFFINLASYNNYIDTNTVNLGWLMIRDIANMFFVVILLIIAFMTILGAGGYEWKKSMGKLIFAAIFINFSNLICGIIIDAAHVFTMTFLSAIVNTAGGNLIQMFSFDKVFQMVSGGLGAEQGKIQFELLGAGFVIVLLTVLIAYTMGAFLIVMIQRVIVLWALIILSPLAFLLQATPRGEKYASEWWSKFLNHVLVAPVMVFFLWLTFATLGTGDVYQKDIVPGMAKGTPLLSENAEPGIENKLSISKVTTWENIANILIAVAFMRVAIMMVQRMDVEGGKFTQGAWGFASKVATIAAGVTLAQAGAERGGRFAKEKGLQVGKGLASTLYTKSGIREGVESTKAKVRMGAPLVGYKAKQAAAKEAAEREQDIAAKVASGEMGKVKGFLKGAWIRAVVSPTIREEKKADAWHKIADDAREIMEMNLKTSETKVGKARGAMATELEYQTALSNQKKNEKRNQLMLEIQLRNEKKKDGTRYTDDEIIQKMRENKSEMLKAQMKVAGKTDDEIKAAIAEDEKKPILLASQLLGEKFMQEHGASTIKLQENALKSKLNAEQFDRAIEALAGVTLRAEKDSLVMRQIKRGKKMDGAASEAKLANMERELVRHEKISVADERAGLYRKQGKDLLALQIPKSAFDQFIREDSSEFAGMQYKEFINRGSMVAEKIRSLNQQGVTGDEINNARAEMMRLINKASEDGEEKLEDLMSGMFGSGLEITRENVGELFAKAIAGVSASDTLTMNNTEINDMFRSAFGAADDAKFADGMTQSLLGSFATNLKSKVGSTGGIRWAGAIKEEFDEKTGAIRFDILRQTDDKNKKFKTEDYVGDNINPRNIRNINGFAVTKDSQVDNITPEMMKQMIKVFGKFADTRSVATGFSQAFSGNVGLNNFTEQGKQKMKEFFKALDAHYKEKYGDKKGKEIYDAIINSQFSEFRKELDTIIDPDYQI